MGVQLRKRGGMYHLDISSSGRRIRKSLKTRDRRRAKMIRAELEGSMAGGIWAVERAIDVTVARGIERFREEYENVHHSPATQEHARKTFERFSTFIVGRHGPKVILDTVRRGDIEGFQAHLLNTMTSRNRTLSRQAVNRAFRELSTLFGWAVRHGLCRLNPCSGVRPLREIRRIVEPVSLGELRRLVKALPELYADVVRLIVYTGLRLGEALHLRREDISRSIKVLYVRSRKDYLVKDREERVIRLTSPALALCRRRIKAAGRSVLLFPSETGGVIDNRNALRVLHEACPRARIRRINWKLLRKTFSTLQGKSLKPWELKAVLGHSDIRTTDKHYMQLAARECRLKAVSF